MCWTLPSWTEVSWSTQPSPGFSFPQVGHECIKATFLPLWSCWEVQTCTQKAILPKAMCTEEHSNHRQLESSFLGGSKAQPARVTHAVFTYIVPVLLIDLFSLWASSSQHRIWHRVDGKEQFLREDEWIDGCMSEWMNVWMSG